MINIYLNSVKILNMLVKINVMIIGISFRWSTFSLSPYRLHFLEIQTINLSKYLRKNV